MKGDDPPDWYNFVSFSSSPDLSDLRDVLVLSKDEIAKYGLQRDDLILQCTYNEQMCNMRYTSRIPFSFNLRFKNVLLLLLLLFLITFLYYSLLVYRGQDTFA